MVTLVCAGIQGSGAIAETPPPQKSKFLQLSATERYWWYEGAFRAVSHLIAMQDKKKGECAADWYLKDRDAKRKLIEDTLAKYPGEGETTIVLSLLAQACGPLAPSQR